jgi:endonuclease YncB( thermonuclease family)
MLNVVTDDQHQLRVHLADVDAPELSQPYGDVSKQSLADLAYGKPVTVIVSDTDDRGRVIGHVLIGSLDASVAQIGRGEAWVARDSKDVRLRAIETGARQRQAGLWREQNPQPPWEYRERHGATEGLGSSPLGIQLSP